MTKHYKNLIDLYVADEGYGTFYDPDFGYDLETMAEDEEVDFKIIQQIELDTAARLSMAYNRTLNIPYEILFDPVFQGWIEAAAVNYQKYIIAHDKHGLRGET